MSSKSARVAALIPEDHDSQHDPRYIGWFQCFNKGQFYEAHDVLEDLWLEDRNGPDGDFFKGLIQLAGAFVHFQKGRPRPARKLLDLAANYLGRYPSPHLDLDLEFILEMARSWREKAATAQAAEFLLERNTPPKLAPTHLPL